MTARIDALSDKEKQTLRLLLRGYDAKSSARELGLSVHTINERLRDARRKLEVSSSREAARLLRDCEEAASQLLVDKGLGAAGQGSPDQHGTSDLGRRAWGRSARILAGGVVMSLVLAFYALSSLTSLSSEGASASASEAAIEAAALQSAQDWLGKVDAADWNGSWAATSASFRKLNTAKVWADVSEQVRRPLGAVQSRVLAGNDFVPAPPNGYQMVKFRTRFANKPATTETLTLVREGGGWKVTGYVIG